MLILGFQIGADRYGLPSAAIEEVISLVDLRALPDAPSAIAGDFNYHGRMVPVIDLHRIALDRSSSRRWSTRILLARLAVPEAAGKLVGLVCERATEMIEAADDANSSDVNQSRLLQIEEFLDGEMRQFLTTHEEEPPTDLAYSSLPPPEKIADETVVAAPPPNPLVRRRRRKPRLAHLEPR